MNSAMDYLHNLLQYLEKTDALTYFMVNSGVFLGAAAGVSFFCGLVFGKLIWGLHRRKLRRAERAIEAYKDEVATLKVRMAEDVSMRTNG